MTIHVQNLKKVYLQEGATPFLALDGFDLEVKQGEIYGIIGGSGAGKSTLMNCLTGIETQTEGTVLIDGISTSGEGIKVARSKMGMIFQQFNLFSAKKVIDNVAFPLELKGTPLAVRRKRAEELLNLVGLKGKEDFYPMQLSGGEKQRVAIARALASDPKILLSDEATSSLDPRSTRAILELLTHLNKTLGLTILLITHEMEVIKEICSRVTVLEHGKVAEEGSVVDLFISPKHTTTRQFLETVHHEIPEHFLPNEKGKELLRLRFRGESAKHPLISKMIKDHNVEVNIVLGGVDRIQNTTVGNLVIELSGSQEERSKARLYLEKHGVICEVIRR